jgi:hypothetical protein
MKLTEIALSNHEELLHNHKSKLQKANPEFNGLFNNLGLFILIACDI